MHIVHCTTASNVLTTPAFLMFIQELWSYSMLADGSVASMSGWMLSQLYDDKTNSSANENLKSLPRDVKD